MHLSSLSHFFPRSHCLICSAFYVLLLRNRNFYEYKNPEQLFETINNFDLCTLMSVFQQNFHRNRTRFSFMLIFTNHLWIVCFNVFFLGVLVHTHAYQYVCVPVCLVAAMNSIRCQRFKLIPYRKISFTGFYYFGRLFISLNERSFR